MRRQNPEIPRNILDLISKKPCGLTIEEVSNELNLNRATVSKHLAILDATGKIIVREIGQSKLHYPKTRRVKSWML